MSRYAPIVFFVSGSLVLASLLFGSEGISKLSAVKATLNAQERKNDELRTYVGKVRQQIAALHTDPRTLEKAARNELGLAREGELIFIFNE